ncbi:hypothetical protein [Pseudomonas lini]|uniref:hypothetical protein n=1 Tax=Pseudomonas lini TaxID=163011 RepID=UPI00126A02B9|nr:hypothetical protein [Pseudomonas lini]
MMLTGRREDHGTWVLIPTFTDATSLNNLESPPAKGWAVNTAICAAPHTQKDIVMGTTMYFEETIKDQGNRTSMDVEIGRSSFYPEDSIYINVDGKLVIMDRATAKRFVEAVVSVGFYHGFTE